MLHREDRGTRLAGAQEIRRVRLRLCVDRAQGARLAVGRRGAVRRILRVSRQPRALDLHRHHARREAPDRRGVTPNVLGSAGPTGQGRKTMSRIMLIGLFAGAFLIASALVSPAIETADGPTV